MSKPDFEAEAIRWGYQSPDDPHTETLAALLERIDAAGYARGVENSAKVAEQVIFDARTGEIDTDLRAVKSELGYRIRALTSKPSKETP